MDVAYVAVAAAWFAALAWFVSRGIDRVHHVRNER